MADPKGGETEAGPARGVTEAGPARHATAADRVAADACRRVIVLVCGEAERGDDGAAFRAVAALPARALAAAEVRRCGTLEVEHLLAIGPDEACLVVDAAVGLPPGEIATGSLESLAARGGHPAGRRAARSTHILPARDVLGLAAALRPGLPPGGFVGIGGSSFGLGEGLSAAVARSLPACTDAIAAEIERLAGGSRGSSSERRGTIPA